MFKLESLVARPQAAPAAPQASVMPAVTAVPAVTPARDAAAHLLLAALAGRSGPRYAPAALESATVAAGGSTAEGDIDPALPARLAEVASALRRETPRQGNPVRLLANLRWLSTPAGSGAAARLPAPVLAAVMRAWAAVPEAATLGTADGLARALRSSGIRLEHSLAHDGDAELQSALPRDWKATLATLAATLDRGARSLRPAFDRTAPPSRHGAVTAFGSETASLGGLDDAGAMLDELATLARAALARVTCTQLANLDTGMPSLPAVVEIPFRAAGDPGLLRLRVDRETSATTGSGEAWSVEFAFDLGALGPLRGRVTLAAGRVSVSLLPEHGALARAIDARFDDLRARLEGAGVAVGRLSCTRADPVDFTRTGSWLVDLRA